MTKQELQTFEDRLQKMGYRKYPSTMNNAIYAWFKGFDKSKHEENRCNYQVAFTIYDFSQYAYMDEAPYSCSMSILLSRFIDDSVNLGLGSININIDKPDIESIEKLAQSFCEWADKNIKL